MELEGGHSYHPEELASLSGGGPTLTSEFLRGLQIVVPALVELQQNEKKIIDLEASALLKILEKIRPILPVVCHELENTAIFSGAKGLTVIDQIIKIPSSPEDSQGVCKRKQLILFEDGSLQVLQQTTPVGDMKNREQLTLFGAVREFGLKEIIVGLSKELSNALKRIKNTPTNYDERVRIVNEIIRTLG